jgi:hypothetical protein
LFIDTTTRSAAINLSATLSPLLSKDEHTLLEQAAVNLPNSEQDFEVRQYLERARDQILVVLDKDRIQTSSAIARLNDIAQTKHPHGTSERTTELGESKPIFDEERWLLWGIDPAKVPELARTTLPKAESALADGAPEPDRWSALAKTVATERQFYSEPELRRRFRYLQGRLINSLLDSERLKPHDVIGSWVADLLIALADDSVLPPAPDTMC